MLILEFAKKFPNIEACKLHLKTEREKNGITCKKCETKTKHFWLEACEKWQCAICNSRTNLKAGTIMENSKMSLDKWFLAIHCMSSAKKPMSALEIQRQLGHKYYEPVLDMVNKIRLAMGERDKRYQLKGTIEIDEGFFEVVNLDKKDRLGNVIEEKPSVKQGRGSDKRKVLVMVESEPTYLKTTGKHKKKRVMGFVKMIVMDDLSSVGINYEVKKAIDPNATIISDSWSGYTNLTDVVKTHKPMVVPAKKASQYLPWVHTMISNAKREFLGIHHSIGADSLQIYLDEFCYKLNRRNFKTDLFDRIMLAVIC